MSSDNTKDNASTNDNTKSLPNLPVTPPSQVSDKNPSAPKVTSPNQVSDNNPSTSVLFSRATLKAMPEQGKQNYLDLICQGFITELKTAASHGHSRYVYTIPDELPHKITKDDLIKDFIKKFPDCLISFCEHWTVKNGDYFRPSKTDVIVIDWR
jgi:hypothetical protein